MSKVIKILIVMSIFCCGWGCANRPADHRVVDATEFDKETNADPDAYILDVRTPGEYAEGHILGACSRP